MKRSSEIASSGSRYALGFKLWLGAVALAVLLVTILATAWLVRQSVIGGTRLTKGQAHFFITIADFPGQVRNAFLQIRSKISDEPYLLLFDKRASEQQNWLRRFPVPEDNGYLLFSGLDSFAKQSEVKLIRISDGAVVAQWRPAWPEIFQQVKSKKYMLDVVPDNVLPVHPLLLDDGDIIYNSGAFMARQSICSGKPVWVLDDAFHHSNELDAEGNVWAPSISPDGISDDPWLQEKMRDDALAQVSPDGKLLEKRSFLRILRDNGMEALAVGMSGYVLEEDPIHMNEIQPALSDTRYWKRGDLLISARNLSTVFLYRPSTNKILWHSVGPWKNQHAAQFIDDHRISVFDNNVVSGAPKEHAFLKQHDGNHVVVYDFATNEYSQPYANMVNDAHPTTVTEGRARILPDGGLFLEETNSGRLMRFSKDRLLWSFVNDYDQQHIGVVSWSRYLTAEEAGRPLRALAAKHCASP